MADSIGLDAIHTLDLPNGNKTSDIEIASLSIKESRVVISKDSDFYDSYFQKLEPYKLIYLTVGNMPTADLLNLFEKNWDKIYSEISGNSLIELTRNSIIVID